MDQVRILAEFLRVGFSQVGVDVSESTSELSAAIILGFSIAVTSLLILWRAVLWVRRRLGDDGAISDDQAAVVRLIARDLENVKQTIERFGHSLNSTLGTQLSEMATKISVNEIDKSTSDQNETEKKGVRLFFAERVRDAAFEKFLTGDSFNEDQRERHQFVFVGSTHAGLTIRIVLATPYRHRTTHGGDADYVLDVRRGDGRQLLGFEWTHREDVAAKVTFLSRDRSWIDDVVEWKFLPNEGTMEPGRAIAAE